MPGRRSVSVEPEDLVVASPRRRSARIAIRTDSPAPALRKELVAESSNTPMKRGRRSQSIQEKSLADIEKEVKSIARPSKSRTESPLTLSNNPESVESNVSARRTRRSVSTQDRILLPDDSKKEDKPIPVIRSKRLQSKENSVDSSDGESSKPESAGDNSPVEVVPRKRVTRSMSRSPTNTQKSAPAVTKTVRVRLSTIDKKLEDSKPAVLDIISENEDETDRSENISENRPSLETDLLNNNAKKVSEELINETDQVTTIINKNTTGESSSKSETVTVDEHMQHSSTEADLETNELSRKNDGMALSTAVADNSKEEINVTPNSSETVGITDENRLPNNSKKLLNDSKTESKIIKDSLVDNNVHKLSSKIEDSTDEVKSLEVEANISASEFTEKILSLKKNGDEKCSTEKLEIKNKSESVFEKEDNSSDLEVDDNLGLTKNKEKNDVENNKLYSSDEALDKLEITQDEEIMDKLEINEESEDNFSKSIIENKPKSEITVEEVTHQNLEENYEFNVEAVAETFEIFDGDGSVDNKSKAKDETIMEQEVSNSKVMNEIIQERSNKQQNLQEKDNIEMHSAEKQNNLNIKEQSEALDVRITEGINNKGNESIENEDITVEVDVQEKTSTSYNMEEKDVKLSDKGQAKTAEIEDNKRAEKVAVNLPEPKNVPCKLQENNIVEIRSGETTNKMNKTPENGDTKKVQKGSVDIQIQDKKIYKLQEEDTIEMHSDYEQTSSNIKNQSKTLDLNITEEGIKMDSTYNKMEETIDTNINSHLEINKKTDSTTESISTNVASQDQDTEDNITNISIVSPIKTQTCVDNSDNEDNCESNISIVDSPDLNVNSTPIKDKIIEKHSPVKKELGQNLNLSLVNEDGNSYSPIINRMENISVHLENSTCSIIDSSDIVVQENEVLTVTDQKDVRGTVVEQEIKDSSDVNVNTIINVEKTEDLNKSNRTTPNPTEDANVDTVINVKETEDLNKSNRKTSKRIEDYSSDENMDAIMSDKEIGELNKSNRKTPKKIEDSSSDENMDTIMNAKKTEELNKSNKKTPKQIEDSSSDDNMDAIMNAKKTDKLNKSNRKSPKKIEDSSSDDNMDAIKNTKKTEELNKSNKKTPKQIEDSSSDDNMGAIKNAKKTEELNKSNRKTPKKNKGSNSDENIESSEPIEKANSNKSVSPKTDNSKIISRKSVTKTPSDKTPDLSNAKESTTKCTTKTRDEILDDFIESFKADKKRKRPSFDESDVGNFIKQKKRRKVNNEPNFSTDSDESDIEEPRGRRYKNINSSATDSSADEESDEDGGNEFIDDMASVGSEDTPSIDSNEIIDEGESVGSTESEIDSEEDYEHGSFVVDDDVGNEELLSGSEELDCWTPKRKRIITIESDSDEEFEKMSTEPFGGSSPSLISVNQVSSVDSDMESVKVRNEELSKLIEEKSKSIDSEDTDNDDLVIVNVSTSKPASDADLKNKTNAEELSEPLIEHKKDSEEIVVKIIEQVIELKDDVIDSITELGTETSELGQIVELQNIDEDVKVEEISTTEEMHQTLMKTPKERKKSSDKLQEPKNEELSKLIAEKSKSINSKDTDNNDLVMVNVSTSKPDSYVDLTNKTDAEELSESIIENNMESVEIGKSIIPVIELKDDINDSINKLITGTSEIGQVVELQNTDEDVKVKEISIAEEITDNLTKTQKKSKLSINKWQQHIVLEDNIIDTVDESVDELETKSSETHQLDTVKDIDKDVNKTSNRKSIDIKSNLKEFEEMPGQKVEVIDSIKNIEETLNKEEMANNSTNALVGRDKAVDKNVINEIDCNNIEIKQSLELQQQQEKDAKYKAILEKYFQQFDTNISKKIRRQTLGMFSRESDAIGEKDLKAKRKRRQSLGSEDNKSVYDRTREIFETYNKSKKLKRAIVSAEEDNNEEAINANNESGYNQTKEEETENISKAMKRKQTTHENLESAIDDSFEHKHMKSPEITRRHSLMNIENIPGKYVRSPGQEIKSFAEYTDTNEIGKVQKKNEIDNTESEICMLKDFNDTIQDDIEPAKTYLLSPPKYKKSRKLLAGSELNNSGVFKESQDLPSSSSKAFEQNRIKKNFETSKKKKKYGKSDSIIFHEKIPISEGTEKELVKDLSKTKADTNTNEIGKVQKKNEIDNTESEICMLKDFNDTIQDDIEPAKTYLLSPPKYKKSRKSLAGSELNDSGIFKESHDLPSSSSKAFEQNRIKKNFETPKKQKKYGKSDSIIFHEKIPISEGTEKELVKDLSKTKAESYAENMEISIKKQTNKTGKIIQRKQRIQSSSAESVAVEQTNSKIELKNKQSKSTKTSGDYTDNSLSHYVEAVKENIAKTFIEPINTNITKTNQMTVTKSFPKIKNKTQSLFENKFTVKKEPTKPSKSEYDDVNEYIGRNRSVYKNLIKPSGYGGTVRNITVEHLHADSIKIKKPKQKKKIYNRNFKAGMPSASLAGQANCCKFEEELLFGNNVKRVPISNIIQKRRGMK